VLNDHERETLREVERRLLADDPAFARAFRARQTHLLHHHHHRRRRRGAIVAVVIAVLLAGLLLALGSFGGALMCAVAVWVIWAMWRHSIGTGGRPS
jgi:hypothetical protein